jgi:transcriptional regulator with XRE-family HTH domain
MDQRTTVVNNQPLRDRLTDANLEPMSSGRPDSEHAKTLRSPAEVGVRIRWLLQQKGVTPAELSRRIGARKGTISHWYHGDRVPEWESAIKLGQELDASPAWILSGGPEVRPGRAAPYFRPETKMTAVELVEKYPNRWTPHDIAIGLSSLPRTGKTDLLAWFDKIKEAREREEKGQHT